MTVGFVKYKIPFIRPSFPSSKAITEDYEQIIASNWFTNFGPFERKFAQQIGEYIGPDYYAVTFSSATAGLLASIVAILGKGDSTKYVIMPSFTFVAGADAVMWCGYKPLFIDIEDQGLHMDIGQAEAALKEYGDNVAGILFCNAFGVGAVNINDWEALSGSYSCPLIIDSAAGFGSLYDSNKKVGTAGRCEVFSFHATKSFAIGEGGAVVTRSKSLAEQLMDIQNFGFDSNRDASQLGFNGKLQEINAAIGSRQLVKYDQVLNRRRKIHKRYKAELDPKRYRLQKNAENAALCFVALLSNEPSDRDAGLRSLHKAGVEAKTYYSPSIHKHSYFKSSDCYRLLTVTDLVDSSVLSLPSYDSLSNQDVDLIISILNAKAP